MYVSISHGEMDVNRQIEIRQLAFLVSQQQ